MPLSIPRQSLKSAQPISLTDIAARFPAVAQSAAHFERSTDYRPVTTLDMVTKLEAEGFNIYSIQVQGLRAKSAHRHGFQKHMLRLRRDGIANGSEYVPELIIQNANDGSSSWMIMLGAFRFICENGIISGSTFGTVRIAHKGENVTGRVIDASYTVINQATALMDRIETWRGINLSSDMEDEFAKRAHAIRYPVAERAPVTSQAMLMVRRDADFGSDLWTVFNRVQENTTRGGFTGRIRGANGRMRNTTMRPVNSIDGIVDVNRQLFDLAETFAAIAA